MRRCALAATLALGLLSAGCALFVDPALPPFADRVVRTRTIDDLFSPASLGGLEMNVVDNGSRSFLLVRGLGRDGSTRVVAFDRELRLRANFPDPGNISLAAPDTGGNFVVGTSLFSGNDFALMNPALPLPGGEAVLSSATFNRLVFVSQDVGEPPASALLIEEAFDAAWAPTTHDEEYYPIVADPTAVAPVALGGFQMIAVQHDPGREFSGIVLWNGPLARHFVVVLARSIVAEPLRPPPVPPDFLDDLPEATVVALPTQDRGERVFYTRRGIVVVRLAGDHEVYSLTGQRTARYRMVDRGDFQFAYSPDGEWVYILDRVRGRLSRASAWW